MCCEVWEFHNQFIEIESGVNILFHIGALHTKAVRVIPTSDYIRPPYRPNRVLQGQVILPLVLQK